MDDARTEGLDNVGTMIALPMNPLTPSLSPSDGERVAGGRVRGSLGGSRAQRAFKVRGVLSWGEGQCEGEPDFFAHSFSLSLFAICPGPRLPNISFDFVREFSRNLRLKNLCLSVFIRG